MKKTLVIACFSFLSFSLWAEELPKVDEYKPSIGWQFYNLPKKAEQKPIPNQPSVSLTPQVLSPVEQMKLIQEKMEEAKIIAIMDPTVQNIATYKVYQDYFVEKSSMFSAKWEEMLLKHPDLDYNIKNSFYNATAPIKEAEKRKEETKAIEYISQRYGIFFFYRGNNPLDNKLAESVKSFSQQYSLSIVPISIDGRSSPDFPNSRTDQGQSVKMNIKHFPALFLVDPKKEEYKPLAYGFITQDDLARRFLNIVTGFKPKT